MIEMIEITPVKLSLCLIFILISGLTSLTLRLKLEKDLAWGTVRTFAQLFLVGYVLQYIFKIESFVLTLVLYTSMVFWATHAIQSRNKEDSISIFLPIFISMIISYTVITILVTAVIIQVKPWYKPQYFIPISGMIIGNSMTAIAISLDRLFSDIKNQRDEIELFFSLGATYQEATAKIFRDAIQAGMIPSINAMMTVGLVKLPGMMTGQILSGVNPLMAIKYQIIVMLMLVASTTIGNIIVVRFVRKLCFSQAHQIAI